MPEPAVFYCRTVLEKSSRTQVQSRWVKESGLMLEQLEKITESPRVAIGFIHPMIDGFPRGLDKFTALKYEYGFVPDRTLGLYSRLKNDFRSNGQLKTYHSWLSIPFPVWKGTLRAFGWERLGVLTEWWHPHTLRIYICDATTSIRRDLWDRIRQVKCDEEYLDPHFVHPLILDVVYEMWDTALEVAENLVLARTRRMPTGEISAMADFTLTTKTNMYDAEFRARLGAITVAMERMTRNHAELPSRVEFLDSNRANGNHSATQNKLEASRGVFGNFLLRCESFRTRLQQHLEAEYRASKILQKAKKLSRSIDKTPKTTEETSKETKSAVNDADNQVSIHKAEHENQSPSAHSSTTFVAPGEAPHVPLAEGLPTESSAQQAEGDHQESSRTTPPQSQLPRPGDSPLHLHTQTARLVRSAENLSRSTSKTGPSDGSHHQGLTPNIPSPLSSSSSRAGITFSATPSSHNAHNAHKPRDIIEQFPIIPHDSPSHTRHHEDASSSKAVAQSHPQSSPRESHDTNPHGEAKPPLHHSPSNQQPHGPVPSISVTPPPHPAGPQVPPKNDTNSSSPSAKPYTSVFKTEKKDPERYHSRIPSGATSPNTLSPQNIPLHRYPSRVPRNPALKGFVPPPPPPPPSAPTTTTSSTTTRSPQNATHSARAPQTGGNHNHKTRETQPDTASALPSAGTSSSKKDKPKRPPRPAQTLPPPLGLMGPPPYPPPDKPLPPLPTSSKASENGGGVSESGSLRTTSRTRAGTRGGGAGAGGSGRERERGSSVASSKTNNDKDGSFFYMKDGKIRKGAQGETPPPVCRGEASTSPGAETQANREGEKKPGMETQATREDEEKPEQI